MKGYHVAGTVRGGGCRKCSGCAVCTRACPYQAIDRVAEGERTVAQVERNLCMHCGICVASCPSGAITLEAVSDSELVTRMSADGWLEQAGFLDGASPAPRILVFVCQWAVRTDAEFERVTIWVIVRVVKLPCSGRVDPALVLMALSRGADGVLVVVARRANAITSGVPFQDAPRCCAA